MNDISLKLLDIQDSQELFEIILKNKSHLDKWLPWVGKTDSSSNVKDFIIKSKALFRQNMGAYCAIIYKKNIVGVVGAFKKKKSERAIYLNYWVCNTKSSRGICTSACELFFRFLKSRIEYDKIVIGVDKSNIPSKRVAEKLKFRKALDICLNNENLEAYVYP